ncbi:glycosyltransferase [Salinimicrobium sp. CDJ15-81-2]|nr:glycosyltransferase [Salinimicrobium nanhaiense]
MQQIKNPLVSVCMITYKHQDYIREAIDGVLSQEVDFSFELIICNDNSPDQTEDVIKSIIKNNDKGGLIRYIKHNKNIGAIPNFHYSFKQAKGKYIAICEGDDFWIDPKKLQKQIDFLESNVEYSASFHEVDMLFDSKAVSFSSYQSNIIENPVLFQDVVGKDWLIPTCSFVFRKDKMILPEFYDQLNYGDYPLFCCILINSRAHYFDEVMAIYRRNNTGSLTNTIRTFGFLNVSADYIQLLNWLYKYADPEDGLAIEQRINQEVENIRRQIVIYKNSKLIKVYNRLRKFIS